MTISALRFAWHPPVRRRAARTTKPSSSRPRTSTADHGCDPTTPSTDHSREYGPLLAFGPKVHAGINLGVRATLSDIGQTVAETFGARLAQGHSFLEQSIAEALLCRAIGRCTRRPRNPLHATRNSGRWSRSPRTV